MKYQQQEVNGLLLTWGEGCTEEGKALIVQYLKEPSCRAGVCTTLDRDDPIADNDVWWAKEGMDDYDLNICFDADMPPLTCRLALYEACGGETRDNVVARAFVQYPPLKWEQTDFHDVFIEAGEFDEGSQEYAYECTGTVYLIGETYVAAISEKGMGTFEDAKGVRDSG